MCRYKRLHTYILLLAYTESIQLLSTICHFMLQKASVSVSSHDNRNHSQLFRVSTMQELFIFLFFFNKCVEKPQGEERGRCHSPEISNSSKSLQPLGPEDHSGNWYYLDPQAFL